MDQETKHVWLQIRTDPTTKRKLQKLAVKNGVSMSSHLRSLINRSYGGSFRDGAIDMMARDTEA